MNTLNFKYFDNVIKNAEYTNDKCQICGTNKYCLEGVYFDSEEDIISVCIECLRKGKKTVNIPDLIQERLYRELKENQEGLDKIKLKQKLDSYVEELKITPPVPWIQYNDWPVCCSDFARYMGEWDKEQINDNAPDGNGKKYIMTILDEFSKSKIDDIDVFWDDIGIYTEIFIFKCINCSKYVTICQNY